MSSGIWLVSGDQLSLSLSVLRQAFVAHEATAWRFRPSLPQPPLSLCLLPIGKDGGSRQERWDWGRGVPLSSALAQTLIYMMLTDVILLQSFILSFSFFLIQADISRQGLRGVADAQLWLAYMFPLSDTYCRASSRNQCLLNTLLSPLYGLFKASQYRFM